MYLVSPLHFPYHKWSTILHWIRLRWWPDRSGGLIVALSIDFLGSASELLSLMLRPSITRACSSPISFNTPPNSAPFVGGCSWDFKLSRDARIFQKARANCWLGQKHASV
ncbi:hypothetical protein LINPERPRIM_LOCUS69, partial [Linum perenne]